MPSLQIKEIVQSIPRTLPEPLSFWSPQEEDPFTGFEERMELNEMKIKR